MAGSLAQYFTGRSVFITGGSGFVGKQVVEKLLRSCSGLDEIYVLIRTKKDTSPDDRLKKLLESPLFQRLNEEQPGFRKKVRAVAGDILLPGLGISDVDHSRITSNASVFIHSAASINFAEPLRDAVRYNILPAQKLMKLARETKSLDSYVHISTAFSQLDKKNIEEKIYEPPIDPYKLIQMVNTLSDEQLEQLTPSLIKGRPNTYTYTKAVAEKLVALEKEDLPLVILRPSIVTASVEEPFPGWVDNYSAATGIFVGAGLGMIKHMVGREEVLLDCIPVDMTANLTIAAAQYASLTKKSKEVKVFNYASSTVNPATIKEVSGLMNESARKVRSKKNVGGRPNLLAKSTTMHRFLRHFDVYVQLPLRAQIADLVLRILGKQPIVVKTQNQFLHLQKVLEYFASNDWHWDTGNVDELYKGLSPNDKKMFNFELRSVNWKTYYEPYWQGIIKYVLKEKDSKQTVPQSAPKISDTEKIIEKVAKKTAIKVQ